MTLSHGGHVRSIMAKEVFIYYNFRDCTILIKWGANEDSIFQIEEDNFVLHSTTLAAK